jgi:hypothetical protein
VERPIPGGLNFIQMLNRTNISVVVGTSENEKYPENKVYFWDDKMMRPVGEINAKDKVINANIMSEMVILSTSKGVTAL